MVGVGLKGLSLGKILCLVKFRHMFGMVKFRHGLKGLRLGLGFVWV